MNNPYQAWGEANAALAEINDICKELNTALDNLDVTPLSKIAIQGFLMRILGITQSYIEAVQPMLETTENK